MRIISGKFKNKKLFFPKNLSTRPLKDSVRESIFNILEHSNNFNIKIKNSNILDLYAGSGSFGFECISREAAEVLFVERDNEAIKNLQKNTINLKIINQSKIFSMDIENFFKKILFKKKYHIIFFDPPYKDYEYKRIFKVIIKKNILDKEHIVIIHREKNAEESIDECLNIIEKRTYGRSEIFFANFF